MHSTTFLTRGAIPAAALLLVLGCGDRSRGERPAAGDAVTRPARDTAVRAAPAADTAAPVASAALPASRGDSLGRVPVLMYHVIADHDALWTVEKGRFRRQLETLYARGYRPITVAQLIDRRIEVPRGAKPVVFTFDDASPSQFRYVRRGDSLVVDPTSAVGIWLDFAKSRPDWKPRATFCLLSGAEAGRSFFGNKGIEGQDDAWRFRKVQWLHAQGFELCNHTLWHATLAKYPDAVVQEQIARGQLAIDSAVPGYKVRTFALPLGVWPKNRALAFAGRWTDAKTGQVVRYDHDAVLEVAGGPSVSPYDASFDPRHIRRFVVTGETLDKLLRRLDSTGTAFVR
jgi:peptidoglycan/xylan/chitin deacetylase (PgdA/CDA1 family)